MAEKLVALGTNNDVVIDGNDSTTTGVLRIGLTGTYYDLGATAGRHGIKCYFTSSATSGGGRGMYIRHKQTGAGTAHSDALRAFESINANTSTASGAHVSLNFLATAGGSECSGLGAALRTTLHIPDIALWAPTGTYTAVQAEIYSDGTASDPAGMTELSFIRIANSGGTGKADVDTDACIFSLAGFTAAADAAHAISSTSLAELPAGSIGLQIKVDGAIYYMPAVIAAEWN